MRAARIGATALWLLSAAVARTEVIDRVLAVVDGAVITLSDVMSARELGLVQEPAEGDPTAAVLAKLIDRQLMLAEVERYTPPEPSAEALDREAQRVRARFASTEAYNRTLARLGIDDRRVRQMLSDDLRLQAYRDQRFVVPPPSDDELNRYYREHGSDFTQNGRPLTFDAARPAIASLLTEASRTMLIDSWIAGLRRRADISDLHLTRP